MRILKTWQIIIQIGWPALCLQMAWHPRGQDINRHNEDHTQTNKTGTTMSSRVHTDTETLSKHCLFGWSALCLQMAWHPRRQDINRHNEDHTHTNKKETTMSSRVHADTETLSKHCLFGWSALCLQMAWHPWRQDINRHNEDHTQTNKTGTTMSSRVHVDTETLTKH